MTSYGILSVGGVISLALGSMMLIEEESVLEAMAISMELIILVVLLTAAFFLFAISLGLKAQKRKPTTGQEGIIGESGTAFTTLNPHGKVKVHGEIWIAEAEEGIIKKGESVLVTAITDLKLKVKKIT